MSVITGLTAYYSLDEASGNALDAHGSSPLTITGSVGTTTGKVSGARDYGSSNSGYFSSTDNADLSLASDTDFTIALWWQAFSDPNSSGWSLLTKSSGEGSGTEYSIYFDGGTSGQKLSFRVGNGSSSAQALSESPYGVFFDTNWHFGVFSHDSVANTLSVQIDGRAAVTTAWSGGTQDGSAAFQLGAYTAWSLNWHGLLDEVGFWKKTLTPTECTWLYNSGNGRSYADIVAEGSAAFRFLLVRN